MSFDPNDDGGPEQFWLTAPSHTAEYGQPFPRYLEASPGNPRSVQLSANVPVMKGGVQVGWKQRPDTDFCRRGSKPVKPRPAHAGQTKSPVKASGRQPKPHPGDLRQPAKQQPPAQQPPAQEAAEEEATEENTAPEVTQPVNPTGRAADRA